MKRSLIFSAILFTASIAQPIFTTVPYYSYTKYSDQFKKDSNGMGIYASLYNYPHQLEFSVDYTNINFKAHVPKYEQSEMTGVYSYFLNKNIFLKGGLHFVASDYRPSNEGLATIISGADYKYNNSNYGLELFYSNYTKYAPKSLKITQIHPYYKYHFNPKNRIFGNFDLMADYNYIMPSKSYLYPDVKDSYSSTGLKLTNNNGKWSTSLEKWIGKRAFALEDGGFTLYNLSQIYTGGYGAGFTYHIKDKASIELKYNHKNYIDYSKKGHSDGITSSFSYTW